MFQSCKSLCLTTLKFQPNIQTKCIGMLSRAEIKQQKNRLFDEEKKKQRSDVGRIDKIEVKYQSYEDEIIMVMNKGLSTPYDCAKHISEGVAKVSAVALVDDVVWDMHKPLISDCNVKLINLRSPEISAVNNAFWRTGSLMLGAVIESAFKDNIEFHLHSFPRPNLKSGSFVHDVYLNIPNWQPTTSELCALSAQFVKLSNQELPIERLETTYEVAHEIFQSNPFKSEQMPDIAKKNNNKITLYRIGDYIDISKGPMVGNTYLMGRSTIASVHKLQSESIENLYRFQGVAIPRGIILNHFAYNILEQRAKKLNHIIQVPQTHKEDTEEEMRMSGRN
ncbi:hypothetical protein KM043_011034 [Ampulex compressa]|nr:hypothetical protein KM043_011034 [Ampulex compressa]